ncbi:hypothetical protein GCM10009535_57750 [Streptomyces thermocarboxydovorans]|uniref:DUF3987 domain-containing protein n=1 Tax=Streptomyces thermocarboxydovorans TaxID=59298 RepID=A0ABN1HW82_9ACTN
MHDAKGKVKIQPEFYRRARPTTALVRELLAIAEKPGHEVFFRVAPLSQDGLKTTKDDAEPVNVIWTEVDSHGLTSEELAFLDSVNATIVESGGVADDGGAKTHVYVPLAATHQPDVIEDLNRALRDRLNGDKFDVTTFLRLPGTLHRKDADNPVRVRVLRYSTATRAKLPDVASALGTDAESTSAQSRTQRASIEPVEPPKNSLVWARARKVRREVDGQIREAVEQRGETIDRSDRLWGLYCELAKVGVLEGEHILWAAQQSKYLAERVTVKDVARFLTSDAYTRARDEWESTQKPEAQPAVSAPADGSNDGRDDTAEAAFWEARPVLTHIRDFAHSRLVSSWAVFGISVARVMNQIPTEVLLPPLVGGRTGLNFYVGIVDSSGVGKGASESAAEECFEAGQVLSVNIGSGEGIAHAYMSRRKATMEEVEEGIVGKGETVMEMHTHSVLFTAPEIDTLTAIKGRSSSTLSAELRKAWSGERLGFMYVTEAKRLTIEKHTYRMTLVCGVQPTRAEALLDESGGGLPQRFLWMPANDPTIPELEDLRDAEAVPLKLPDFFHELNAPRGMVTVDVCESARREIRQHQHAKIKRTVTPDPLDSHRNLVRLKVAAALAFMDGRKGVSEEDWALADVVMSVSDRTRDFIRHEITRARSDISRERGRDDAIREVAKREHVETETTRRVWRRLDEVLRAADKPMTVSDLQKKVPPRDREEVADVVAEMSAKGLVREAGTNRKGNAMYERAG